MFRSLTMKLTGLMALLLVIALVASQTVNYVQMASVMKDDAKVRAESLVTELVDDIEHSFDSQEDALKQFSETKSFQAFTKTEDAQLWQDIDGQLATFLNIHKKVQLAYIGTANGNMYTTPAVDLPPDFDPTTRPWYKAAVASPDKVIWTESYVDAVTNDYIVTIAKAVVENGQVIGVIGLDVSLNTLAETVEQSRVGYNGYPVLFDQNKFAIVHPQYKGKDMSDHPVVKTMFAKEKGAYEYEQDGEKRLLYFATIPKLNWKVGAVYKEKDLLATLTTIGKASWTVVVIATILASLLIYAVSRSIVKPIIQLNERIQQVATGDLTVHVDPKGNDEIAQLTSHFNEMVSHMRSLIGEVDRSVAELGSAADHLSAVSEETMATSEQVTTAVTDIAKGVSEQASNLDAMNDRMNDLSEKMGTVTQSAERVKQLSDETKEASYMGIEKLNVLQAKSAESQNELRSVETVITDLGAKMNQIGAIIQTITDISAQTNLLALNASIEAARAGEHGKGFAVVAEEVRKLAEQSAQATEQIRQTITSIQEQAALATEAVDHTKQMNDQQQVAVNETAESFMHIATMMEQLTSAIEHIFTQIHDVNENKEQIVAALQNLAAISEQSAASAEEVSASSEEQLKALSTVTEAAERLNDMSRSLQQLIHRFRV
ncbi:methyl-accepting chemotaxis protein [Anoxybacillus sp. LAT_35]|uniref:methyl-accepting chemotaxis protein n=1 Tax=unclassified Anoxybacillus TaxID=2639704 RepID=UPI001EEAE714|nr:methyl-accepting chemotaxis protein [Anoxybacillus sp. LAT_26]MCG6171361.1 methyl-accepting chemotaxis protein [Anoxybacillus sp. LAT_11]MCG6178895.1 methyl-accepting chemotaxis protein [Anoxybacillus sp. LAT_35]MCG6185579.1 methyl-accepting chemotaxis protein [Anoxybacillus sp. LAT_26]MCG6195712.1 methyl-accepting chemotaxis protein [Anoxybacillus sp. LAT_38]